MPGLSVLHVLEAAGHGTGRHLVDLVTHATDVRHEVLLPTRPTPRGEDRGARTAEELRTAGVVVHTVGMRRNPAHPDLLRATAAARRLLHDRDLALAHGHATIGGVVARLAARAAGRPAVVTPHGLHPSSVVRGVERALGGWTDALVAVSASEGELAARLRLCAVERVHVVPNGIALEPPPRDDRDLRADLALDAHTTLVGWVGRMSRQKAPELVVEAVAAFPSPVHAVLIGGGPDVDAVVARVRQSGLGNRVHLVGHVPGAAALMGQLDVLALPSRWEGAPYVPLEAFRARVPVVATDVVGTRDVVVDGETGWLVAPDDPVALAAAIRDVLDRPDEARRRVSLAHDRLVAHHDVRAMASATVRVYRQVTSDRQDRR